MTSWPHRAHPLEPKPGTVSVLRFGLDYPDPIIQRMAELLAEDELARADRFAFPRLRGRYVAGRAALRIGLGSMLGIPARDVVIAYGPNGKPTLADSRSPLRFNLSHAGGVALLAITALGDVGIDIEAIDPSLELDTIAERMFSARELAAYLDHDPVARVGAFFRCWTRKEAFIKATGEGLAARLDGFDVTLSKDETRLLRLFGLNDPGDWTLLDLPTGPGFTGALAIHAPEVRLSRFAWEPVNALNDRGGLLRTAGA